MCRRTLLFALLLALIVMAVAKEPSRWGFADRVERHMLPAVTTGPFDPAWSADGRIAFAAQGDIWVVPGDGGDATAVTQGPSYYLEPAWSPDGKQIACSIIDPNWKLGIGVINVESGEVQTLDTGAGVAVEPAWSHDGKSLYYVHMESGGGRAGAARGAAGAQALAGRAARGAPGPGAAASRGARGGAALAAAGFGGGTTIYRHDFDGAAADVPVVRGFEPAVSPDGTQLAYMASVPGMESSGGIWVRPIAGDDEPRLVRYEETEYRTKPAWTPDGKSFLYVSDEEGPNAVRIISAGGGNPVRLTMDDRDEYSPTPSPDGKRFAFVSNRAGATVLYTVGIAGGRFSAWQPVPLHTWKARTPRAKLRIRVLDAQKRAMPANVFVTAADGRFYAPDGGFERAMQSNGERYFETTGESEISVPPGKVTIEAWKGYEYKPASVTVVASAGGTQTATVDLQRLVNLPAQGWYSGDPHIHDLHQGDFGLTHEVFFNELVAADLHVTSALIHMDGTRIMGRWSDLTGKPSPLSTPDYILQYAEEFRGSLGHIELLGIHEFILPFDAGDRGGPYAQPTLDSQYIDAAHAQGGIAGYPHPYATPPNTPQQAGGTLIAVDAALGKGDFYDVGSLYSDEIGSAEFYDRILNSGIHLAASAGTDNFSDVELDPPPGSDRAYVHVHGPLTLQSWMAGLKAGHSFGSTGPLLTLNVAGHEPGDEIRLAGSASPSLHVHADAISIAAMSELDVLVNGQVAQKITATDPLHIAFDGEVSLPQGGWVGLRAEGPSSKYVGDTYVFAQTTPVYVLRDGKQWTSASDAQFLADTAEATWTRVQNSPWRSDAERDAFHAQIEQARAIYEKIVAASPAQ